MTKIKISKEHSRLLWTAGIKASMAIDVLNFILEDEVIDLDDECLEERVKRIKKDLNHIAKELYQLSRCPRKEQR